MKNSERITLNPQSKGRQALRQGPTDDGWHRDRAAGFRAHLSQHNESQR